MITENLSTLKIHSLTKEQYERELAAGRIDENALYLTPYEETDLSIYATQEHVEEALAQKQPIGDYALNSEVTQAKQEAINMSNTYTDEQIESVLIYVNDEDIEALF